MGRCVSNLNKNKCSWCTEYKNDSKNILFYSNYHNKYICKSCYYKIYGY